jgi:pilus assembly protein FimV
MLARMLAKSPRPTLATLLASGFSLAGCLFTSLAAHAQGLGELTLESALNEPLRARIELLDVSGLEESQILIGIASPDEYEQAGLERSALVAQVEFDIELQPLGGGSVILTSQDRITEPFLTLLVSARWPSGRLLRDYTVLLDLPGTNPAGNAAAAPAGSSVAAPAGGASGAGTYAVQSGDSLWEIAEQTRPDSGVAVPQMMIALQRANEDAFVNNNVNRLINGRVLRIPTRDEIAIIEPAAAIAQVSAQNQEVGLQPLNAGGTGTAGATRDELSVLGGDAAAAGGSGSSDLAATIAALEAELMLSEEDLDRARIENEELTAQLAELEEQIAILQNIIAIEDERIAQLQNELAAQAQATDEALSEAGRAADVLAASGQTQGQGFLGQVLTLLQNNLVFIGVALAVVLAALGVLVARARRAAADDEFDFTAVRATPVADYAEQQGFLARLLTRFRRGGGEDEYEGAESALREAAVPAASRRAPEIEVDEIPDELAGGLYDDEEFQPAPAAAQTSSPVAADDSDEDAAALASSVLDEIDSALREIDESDESDEMDAAVDGDSASVATADGVADDIAEFEFDMAEPEPAEAATVEAEAIPEAFEFKVTSGAEAVAASTTAEPEEPELETLSFSLDPAPADAAEEAPAVEAEPVIETFEFKPAASSGGGGFDLGSLSFDENDAREADEAESPYTPRSNMDECDTKLDLAVAYEAMGDIDGAVEILDEVIAEGKPAQVEEAKRLKTKWQDA